MLEEKEIQEEEATNTVSEAEATENVESNSQTDEQSSEDTKITRKRRKERVGKVTSNKMNKTITVLVERRVKHPMYGKFVTKSTKFLAHDDKEEAGIGDTVRIMECRPLSKRKRWRLTDIIEKAK